MNPYARLVSEFARLVRKGKKLPLGGFTAPRHPTLLPDAPVVLIFSPHPDDECIIGALPLRLLRQSRMDVLNVPVTLGSKPSRRAARLRELRKACGYLGFGLIPTTPCGLEKITVATRKKDKARWSRAVKTIAGILSATKPRVIFLPHEKDLHPTHVGTHFLVMDALAALPRNFSCFVVETEFWGAMETPNLMVESSERDVADLVTALSCHSGEVRRNPYHLRLAAWMQDNVRRGSELVGGPGSAAPDFGFATLYRLRKWQKGRLVNTFSEGRLIAHYQNPARLFAR